LEEEIEELNKAVVNENVEKLAKILDQLGIKSVN
jgi:hypothetical protein